MLGSGDSSLNFWSINHYHRRGILAQSVREPSLVSICTSPDVPRVGDILLKRACPSDFSLIAASSLIFDIDALLILMPGSLCAFAWAGTEGQDEQRSLQQRLIQSSCCLGLGMLVRRAREDYPSLQPSRECGIHI